MQAQLESRTNGFTEAVAQQERVTLGPILERSDIESTMSPFRCFPEYRTVYPESVTTALGDLYIEYNQAFGPLVDANKERDTDYRYAVGPDGRPINSFVQIDMVGIPPDFLRQAGSMRPEEVQEVLRGAVFEIENSLAMYQLMRRIFSGDGPDASLGASQFEDRFDRSLDQIRARHNMPIALLAVTDAKLHAIKETEFGKHPEEPLRDDEVRRLSGFDALLGPNDLVAHLRQNHGRCGFLLYARTSDPVAKLRQPDLIVESPLLEDPYLRGVIKEHAITFNVDDPRLPVGDPRRINDTKAYMPTIGMGYGVHRVSEIFSPGFVDHLLGGRAYKEYSDGNRLAPELVAYLLSRGVNPEDVENGRTRLRGKPMKGAYGSYGHIGGVLNEGRKIIHELGKTMRERGPYVLQPEFMSPVVVDDSDGTSYTYMDRNIFAFTNGRPQFLGGFRALMPLDSVEAQSGRLHGANATVWGEIS